MSNMQKHKTEPSLFKTHQAVCAWQSSLFLGWSSCWWPSQHNALNEPQDICTAILREPQNVLSVLLRKALCTFPFLFHWAKADFFIFPSLSSLLSQLLIIFIFPSLPTFNCGEQRLLGSAKENPFSGFSKPHQDSRPSDYLIRYLCESFLLKDKVRLEFHLVIEFTPSQTLTLHGSGKAKEWIWDFGFGYKLFEFGHIISTSPFPYLRKDRVILRPPGHCFYLRNHRTLDWFLPAWGRKDMLDIYSVQSAARQGFPPVTSCNPPNNLVRLAVFLLAKVGNWRLRNLSETRQL